LKNFKQKEDIHFWYSYAGSVKHAPWLTSSWLTNSEAKGKDLVNCGHG